MPSGLACAARMITSLQDPQRLLVGLAGELVDRLGELLGAEYLGGVEAAVDPDHRLAFAGQRPGLIVGEPLGQRQLPRDVPVAIELLEVLGRADDRHQLVAALGGLADRLDDHAVGFLVDEPHELGELGVVRQDVVGADWMAEERFGRGDPRRSGARRRLDLRQQGHRGHRGERERTRDQHGAAKQSTHGRQDLNRSTVPQNLRPLAQRDSHVQPRWHSNRVRGARPRRFVDGGIGARLRDRVRKPCHVGTPSAGEGPSPSVRRGPQ